MVGCEHGNGRESGAGTGKTSGLEARACPLQGDCDQSESRPQELQAQDAARKGASMSERMQYVYALTFKGDYVKIGKTANFKQRFRD